MNPVPVLVVGPGEGEGFVRLEFLGPDSHEGETSSVEFQLCEILDGRSTESTGQRSQPTREDASDSNGLEKKATPSSESAGNTVRSLMERVPLSGSRNIEVHLRPPFAQTRTLRDVPPVNRRDLRKLIRAQRDRFFRPADGEIVVNARWQEDPDGDDVVRAALAETEFLELLEDLLGRCDVRVSRFLPVGVEGIDSDEGLELLSPTMAFRRKKRLLWHIAGAVGIAISAWLAAGGIYAFDLIRDNRFLRAEVGRVDALLAEMDSLEARVSEFSPAAEVLNRQSPESAWAGEALVDIAGMLPRQAHLHSLTLERDGSALVETHTRDQASVVDSLRARWDGQVLGTESSTGDASVRQTTSSSDTARSSRRSDEVFTVVLEPTP